MEYWTCSKTPNGSFHGKLTIGKDENGNRIRKDFYGKTRRICEQKRDDYLKLGTKHVTTTLRDMVEYYLDSVFKNDLSPKTIADYKNTKKALLDEWGNYYIKNLHTEDINLKFIEWSSSTEGHRGKELLKKIRRLGKSSVDYYNAENETKFLNPFSKVLIPKEIPKDRKPWTETELETVIAYCKNQTYKTLFCFLKDTGCRLGEALALTTEDLSWNDSEVRDFLFVKINKSLKNTDGSKYKQVIGPPKTRNSYRKIVLSDRCRRELQTLLVEKNPHDIIFASKNGTYLNDRNVRRAFYDALFDCNIKRQNRTIHDIRHFAISTIVLKKKKSGLEFNLCARDIAKVFGHTLQENEYYDNETDQRAIEHAKMVNDLEKEHAGDRYFSAQIAKLIDDSKELEKQKEKVFKEWGIDVNELHQKMYEDHLSKKEDYYKHSTKETPEEYEEEES